MYTLEFDFCVKDVNSSKFNLEIQAQSVSVKFQVEGCQLKVAELHFSQKSQSLLSKHF